MTHFIKACQRLATDALSRAVGQFQLRVIQLQCFKLAEQFVIFGIGYAGRV
ncbi:Uncharacterised protein [Mycobacteroides abscessus subsp. massiliense]|nr:Uncharacterised protein [Mycobacteroides abscessus subsp. massiliense]